MGRGLANRYNAVKDELYKDVIAGATLNDLKIKYNLSNGSAQRWRDTICEEMSCFAPAKAETLKKRYFAVTLGRLELCERFAFRRVMKEMPGAVKDMCVIIKTKSELLSRFGIIPKLEDNSMNINVTNIQSLVEDLKKSIDANVYEAEEDQESKSIDQEADGDKSS